MGPGLFYVVGGVILLLTILAIFAGKAYVPYGQSYSDADNFFIFRDKNPIGYWISVLMYVVFGVFLILLPILKP